MKKVLFVLGIVVVCNKGFSQAINPFKLDAIEWQELQSIPPQYGTYADNSYNFYRICGDTLYNDTLYKKMYFGSVFYPSASAPPPWLVPKTAPSYSFYCFFRQDTITKSNYYRMPNSNDSLLCSYNLNIGDTLKRGKYANEYYSITQSGVPTIKKIDSVLIEGKKFKRYYTDTCGISGNSSGCNYNKICYLIEGLGHNSGIFYSYTNVTGEYSWNKVDSMAFSINCNIMGSGIKTLQQNSQTTIYPNPSTGNFTIETQSTLYNIHCTIYDVNGRVVLTQTINGRTNIDASALPNGIYNISLTSVEGVVNKRLVIVK